MKLIPNENGSVYLFWCPGCGHGHVFTTKADPANPNHPVWTFDGNMEEPTFGPSLLNWHDGYPADGNNPTIPPRRCHLMLERGEIRYLEDCTHALAGQKTKMVEVPGT